MALGGSLYQDIVTENPAAISHVDSVLYDQHRHAVLLEENSRLTKLYDGNRAHLVNSIHHQAIKRLGEFRDVANVIDFFIRPESDFITGQVLYLGGV